MTYEFSEEIRAFLQEKRFLQNVSPKTILLYESCFKAFPELEEPAIRKRVVEMRTVGLSPVTVNTYLRHIKTFFLWKGLKWSLPWLKEEQKILSTLDNQAIGAVLRFKPKGINQSRSHLVALLVLDCGLRISEALSLCKEDVNLENLTIRVVGKGGKHRLVPFSKELRARLYRNIPHGEKEHLFPTRSGGKVSVRNMERDFKALFKKIGIEGVRASPHTVRHSFAVCYLRNGGNLEFLRRYLGHSSLTTTQKYLKSLGVEDLGAVHASFSPLSVRR